ncbi:spike base protein, RCAP_Rcc01079 family [Terrihabitans sp. B22-R8]|uniref:spike base protein, RCAP_Rcc01079 family n=1 Tax=Terrihabitans sp. B22-R8 TaxID=3425128 RepID=UPI00403C7489
MAELPFPNYSRGPNSLGTRMRVIAPGNANLDPVPKTVTHLTGGDITIVPFANPDGEAIAFKGVPAGWIAPCVVRRVTAATGTVATVEG